MTPTCLEVALNGPWGAARQPLAPLTTSALIAEGIACARAGAAVIHLHVYDPATGRQWEDFGAYRAVIEGIRAVEDVIVYPTLPLTGSPDTPAAMPPEARFATVERLARAGLLEWSVIDPGSAMFAAQDEIAQDRPGFLYHNPEADIRHGLALARRYGFHPSYAIYEPGFARLGAALAARFAGLPQPVYRLMFSDGFAFGFPPRDWALDAYLHLLEELAPGAPWMVAGLQVDVTPLIAPAVSAGGHVRVGLEDAPFHDTRRNVDWAEAAATAILRAGGTLASPAQVRAALARGR
ncbi:MAG: 3-keto-5-aminohexanoate cleavage protein [Roseivivax sp.]|nr:3-keto-5-aminohexanoate cleavage protein [Roseivivax sp.]